MYLAARISGILVCLSVLVLIGACSDTNTPDKKPVSKSAQDPAINAKAVMDKVHNTIDTAVDSKMEQLETVNVPNLYDNPEAYLAMNAKKQGFNTTESGLQYRVSTAGKGPQPLKSSRVQVHYRGTFPDGREFDSSYKRGEPAVFGVTQVISGWTEALLMMNEGSKWELVIPPELAYGARGRPGIPPNQVLKFDIELLDANYQ